MANQTVTTTVNHDSAAVTGLLNGDDYIINGGSVTLNCDARWGQNDAVIGNITLSSSLGGSFIIDGTQVWELPFSSSTGNVPTLAALGSNGVTGGTSGATGELFRVWATGSLTPAAAGGAMPASGWIKLRSKTGDFQTGEVVTLPGGATVTISGPGKRSWLQMVGEEATTVTVPRLGNFSVQGDWYELGTTNGTDDQTFQFPVADACPAIWVETAPGSNTYEIWLNAGNRWGDAIGSVAQNDGRGKWFGMNNATGVITIARRASNACGYKPPSGCKVRIPNVIWSNSTSANWAANTINATLATRHDFTTTSAGAITIDKASLNCFLSLTSAYEVEITNTGILDAISFNNVASTTTLTDVGIGLNAANIYTAITIVNAYSPSVYTRVRAARYAAVSGTTTVSSFTDGTSFTLTDCRFDCFGNTSTLTRGVGCIGALFTRVFGVTITNPVLIGCTLSFGTCTDIVVTNTQYADQQSITTTTTRPHIVFNITTGSKNIVIDGFSNFENLANVHPRTGFLSTATNVADVEMKNIGTYASPYNCGTVNPVVTPVSLAATLNVTLRRIYYINEGGQMTVANTAQNLNFIDVRQSYARTQAFSGLNLLVKGNAYTNSTTGQTAVYGTHWADAFTATTTGRIVIACNEPLPVTSDQCVATLTGTSGWTSTGSLSMVNIGDSVEWTMPYFALGHTGFANTAPTITGTNAANHTIEFQYDTGSGFNGSWLTLNGANLSGIGAINPATGVRLKVRATVNTANTGNLLTYIRIDTTSSAVAQEQQHPLPVVYNNVDITNLQAGSRVQVYNQTTATEVINEVVAGTSFNYQYVEGSDFTTGDVVRIRITKVSGLTAYLPIETLALAGATGFAILAQQELDTVYNTNAIDGSTVTEFVTDYPNVQIDVSDPDGSTRIDRLYAWWVYNQNTEEGIRQWLGGLVAEDLGNYRVVTSKLDLKIDNLSASGVQFTGGLRLYRDDGTNPLVASTTGGGSITMYADKVYIAETGVSGLTTEEMAILEDARNKAALAASLSA